VRRSNAGSDVQMDPDYALTCTRTNSGLHRDFWMDLIASPAVNLPMTSASLRSVVIWMGLRSIRFTYLSGVNTGTAHSYNKFEIVHDSSRLFGMTSRMGADVSRSHFARQPLVSRQAWVHNLVGPQASRELSHSPTKVSRSSEHRTRTTTVQTEE